MRNAEFKVYLIGIAGPSFTLLTLIFLTVEQDEIHVFTNFLDIYCRLLKISRYILKYTNKRDLTFFSQLHLPPYNFYISTNEWFTYFTTILTQVALYFHEVHFFYS